MDSIKNSIFAKILHSSGGGGGVCVLLYIIIRKLICYKRFGYRYKRILIVINRFKLIK